MNELSIEVSNYYDLEKNKEENGFKLTKEDCTYYLGHPSKLI